MNIFVLHGHPELAAQHQCDKHVVKMCLETAQLLCSVFPNGVAPYRRTHYNHPCSKWARASYQNYAWLIQHGYALCEEYTKRYHKRHKSEQVIMWCDQHTHLLKFPEYLQTEFPLCMPNECKRSTVVESYRTYYRMKKISFATWKNGIVPAWMIHSSMN